MCGLSTQKKVIFVIVQFHINIYIYEQKISFLFCFITKRRDICLKIIFD